MRFLLVFFVISSLAAQQPDHQLFTKVLKKVVDEAGRVDYQQLADQPEPLMEYLNDLITHPPKENWKKEEVLAYWINTYNAFTLKLIADHYPLKSIRELEQPWDRDLIPFKGRKISLNHVEHQILRKMDEPRIHFAINCASVSCPVLAEEAYLPQSMEAQLTQASRNFLIDPTRNLISKDSLRLSKIFKWFRKDFTKNSSLTEFISAQSGTPLPQDTKIDYLEYNWDLNVQ